MSFFDKLTFRHCLNNGFQIQFSLKSDYPVHYQDWSFNYCPIAYKKYRRFLCYSEPYTKHYMFDILCKKIDINSEFDNNFILNTILMEKTDSESNVYKNIEYIFDKYHSNWKYFYMITKDYNENYEKICLDTTQLDNNEEYLNNFTYDHNYNRIIEPDYELIKEFNALKKPLYMLILPENITEFKCVYAMRKDCGQALIYAVSEKYLYYIYSQR